MELSSLEMIAYCALCVSFYVLSGSLLYRMATHFVTVRPRLWWKAILMVTLVGATGMVIWVGDPNILYTLPPVLVFFLLATRGDWIGRLAVAIIFFCAIMSVCAMADTYIGLMRETHLPLYDFLTRLARPIFFTLLYLFLRRRLPQGTVTLPRRLWKLVFGLSLMPLLALMVQVLLAYPRWRSMTAYTMSLNQSLVLLPFSGITAVILLFVILALADHERLEQEVHLAGLREVYYQGLQREHTQVRTLRHDLRNHITAVQGLLARGESEKASAYLDQLTASPSLSGGRRVCDNAVANAVFAAKAQEMDQRGLRGDFQVVLPQDLAIGDTDLCALLGNALDNAMEAAEKSEDKGISVRCREEMGLFMLRVENALAGDEQANLSTTKKDKLAHGFGLPGMREIARRYGGSLETKTADGRFELVVCLPL